MKFRRRREPLEVIEAEQFRLGHEPYPAPLQRVLIDQANHDHVLCVYGEQPKKRAIKGYAVKTPGGDWWVVHDGDWIFAENGGHYAYSDARWNELYEPVEE